MNNDRTQLLTAALGALVVGTNIYWRRRYRHLYERLTRSREWDDRSDVDTGDGHGGSEHGGADSSATLSIAAKKASVSPRDLPERIEELNEQVDDQSTKIGRIRKNWSRWWVDEYVERDELDGRAVVVNLDRGESADAKLLAKRTVHSSSSTAWFIYADADDTFYVTVGDELRDEYRADELAEEVTAIAGGGSGGTASLASGGGGGPEKTLEACRRVADRLREETLTSDAQS